MKYNCCFWFLMYFFVCFSQKREKGTIEYSPISGYSVSQQGAIPFFASSVVSGIQVGIYGNYFFSNRWSLRSGLLYQEMGTNEIKFLFLNNNYSERTKYLSIPLTINYHFGSNSAWYFIQGISLGILAFARGDFNDGNGFVDIKNISNPIQFGFNGGLGYKFEIMPDFLVVVENSNMISLTDTTKEKSGKNFYMSFNFGMVFTF